VLPFFLFMNFLWTGCYICKPILPSDFVTRFLGRISLLAAEVPAVGDRAGVSHHAGQWHGPRAAVPRPWLYSVGKPLWWLGVNFIPEYRSTWFKVGVLSQRAAMGRLLWQQEGWTVLSRLFRFGPAHARLDPSENKDVATVPPALFLQMGEMCYLSVRKHLPNRCSLPRGMGSPCGPPVAIYGAGVDLACCWGACDGPAIFLKCLEHRVVQGSSLEGALVWTDLSAWSSAAVQAATGVLQPKLGQPASPERDELGIEHYHGTRLPHAPHHGVRGTAILVIG